MAESAAEPEKIAVDPPEQVLSHEQLITHAAAQQAKIAGHTAPEGMRGEHAAALNALFGRTRSALGALTGMNERGVGCVQMFDGQEDANAESVDAQESNIPKFT